MSEENKNYEENDTVTLTLDDDTELVCDVITMLECNGQQYIALLPQDAGEEAEVFLYRFKENGDDIDLQNIESDDEFEMVSDKFDEWMDSVEFDEMFGDDDEQ